MRTETILARAEFDPLIAKYWMLSTLFALAVSIIGLPLVPFWLFFGWGIHQRQYERLECELTERSLNIRRGLWFRVEKHIPLDKIQDVGMKEGPILRKLGLSSLVIETAGQSAAQGVGDATLVGVVDAPGFRDKIIEQRERIIDNLRSGQVATVVPATATAADAHVHDVLVQIRDGLQRIEVLLAKKKG